MTLTLAGLRCHGHLETPEVKHPYITTGSRPTSALLPGKDIFGTEFHLENPPAFTRWLCYSTSGDGFLPVSLAFIFEKYIRYDKKTHPSSSISRVLQDHRERRAEQDPLSKLTACKKELCNDAWTESLSPSPWGAFKPTIQERKGWA